MEISNDAIDAEYELVKRNVNEVQLHKVFKKGNKKAEELLNDPDKLEDLLQKLERKLNAIPVIGTTFSMVPAMISLVRSYSRKEYTEAPLGTIVGIVSALVYVVSPIDLIPDAVPVLGEVDDAAVILMCLRSGAAEDLREYNYWREQNNKVNK